MLHGDFLYDILQGNIISDAWKRYLQNLPSVLRCSKEVDPTESSTPSPRPPLLGHRHCGDEFRHCEPKGRSQVSRNGRLDDETSFMCIRSSREDVDG